MSEPPGTTGEGLRKAIETALVRNHRNKKFLPADQAARLTTRERVLDQLSQIHDNENDVQWLADYVVAESTNATALYLLLANINNLAALHDLARHGYSDADLPVHQPEEFIISVNWTSKSGKPEVWPVLDNWDLNDQDLFQDRQWMFLAPVFTSEKFQHELETESRLPFMTRAKPDGKGHYSSVCKVSIHGAHQTVFPSNRAGKPFEAALKVIEKGVDAFAQENKFLDIVRLVNHRHLITPLASISYRDPDQAGSFLFPWASGGNLIQAWRGEKLRHGALRRGDRHLADWTLTQIHGLGDAVKALHSKEGRHGDIKPENILLFQDSSSSPGTLQLADFGLGRFHANGTSERRRREQKTKTANTTSRYMPPEFLHNIGGQLPRSQDVWSLGCVFLEFIAWAVWGTRGLDDLSKDGMQPFWQDNGPRQPRSLHKTTKAVIDNLKKVLGGNEPSHSAFYDVVDLVETRMLVAEQDRWKCDQLMERLDGIHERSRIDQEYLLGLSLISRPDPSESASAAPRTKGAAVDAGSFGVPEIRVSDETGKNQALLPLEPPTKGIIPTNRDVSTLQASDEVFRYPMLTKSVDRANADEPYKIELGQGADDDKWVSKADNPFAETLFQSPGWPLVLESSKEAELCELCARIDIWTEHFEHDVQKIELTESANRCRLCKLFCQAFDFPITPEDERLCITRVGSGLVVDPDSPPFLSTYIDPEHVGKCNEDAQVGTPLLPDPASTHQFELMKTWIEVCLTTHGHTGVKEALSVDDRPSRVIDVGSTAQPLLRLVDGTDMETQDYVALSHCWGPRPELHFGKTLSDNYLARRTAIDPSELPLNFQDAIEVARGLGVRYLWIDSICIIQHDKEDWKRESVKMEQVYSNAKCVLAASSAALTTDGFLRHSRKPREFVTLTSSSGVKSYVCENIDNFKQDVEESVLNTRGWVLQERALARRTIHFAATQTYFECGDGKRCESLMKLTNEKSAALGDSDFPKSAENLFRGGRIMLLQNLYELYSRLDFGQPMDRPIGISGLEKRLASAFKTRGGYGVFDDTYLERNLLWTAAADRGLKPIDFASARKVPSWSWMAYSGAISYIHIDFRKVQWTREVKSPFNTDSGDNGKQHWEANDSQAMPVLILSKVRRLASTLQPVDIGRKIAFDCQGTDKIKPSDLRCVVLGKQQTGTDSGSTCCYVLVIRETTKLKIGGKNIYERLGAGELGEDQIDFSSYESGECH